MGGPGSGRRATPDTSFELYRDLATTPPEPFESAEFVAWISSITPNRAGVKINMMVKFQDREMVKPLWDAIGIPLLVQMREWDVYREAKDQMEGVGQIVVPD